MTIEKTMEALGEQLTWEFLKCEGKWLVWISNNDLKVCETAETLETAVALASIEWELVES